MNFYINSPKIVKFNDKKPKAKDSRLGLQRHRAGCERKENAACAGWSEERNHVDAAFF